MWYSEIMKIHLGILLAALYCSSLLAGDANELTYEGKPITYWMDAFSFNPGLFRWRDKNTAIKAIETLGFKAAPYMIAYARTNGTRVAGAYNDTDSKHVVNQAFSYFSDEDKEKVKQAL